MNLILIKSIKVVVTSDTYSTDDENDFELANENNILNKEKTLFKISIPYTKYEAFQPSTVIYNEKYCKRSYSILKQYTWSDAINGAFIETYNLPCTFIYKNCKVRKYVNRSKYFFTFKGKCKDDGCELFGWSEQKPDVGQSLEINILNKDTRGHELTHNSKRPLKGTKRKIVGQELKTDLASN